MRQAIELLERSARIVDGGHELQVAVIRRGPLRAIEDANSSIAQVVGHSLTVAFARNRPGEDDAVEATDRPGDFVSMSVDENVDNRAPCVSCFHDYDSAKVAA